MVTVLAGLALSCATTQPQPPASPSTPPPVPPRPERFARVQGHVSDVYGHNVAGADVGVVVGDENCQPVGERRRATTRANGWFQIETDIGMGSPEQRCVFIDASAGGSSTRVQRTLMFFSDDFSQPRPPDADIVNLHLPRPPALTPEHAQRIVELFTRAMSSHDPELFREVATYTGADIDTLVQTLSDFSSSLRGVTRAEMIQPYVYRLTGRTGQQATIEVTQDALTRIKGGLIEASPQARALIRSALDVIERGDADRLAAVIRKSAAEARDVIERYGAMSLRDQRPTLRTIDEAGQTLGYALGNERIEVGYGNNTVWIRSM